MKAVVFEDTRRVGVHEVPDAALEEATDVVVRVTSSAICGTDLHMFDGRTGPNPGCCSGTSRSGSSSRSGPACRWWRRAIGW